MRIFSLWTALAVGNFLYQLCFGGRKWRDAFFISWWQGVALAIAWYEGAAS